MNLSFKQKLTAGFMLIGAVPVMIVSVFNMYEQIVVAKEAAKSRLMLISAEKEYGVRMRLKAYESQIRTLSSNRMVQDAMVQFTESVEDFDADAVQVDEQAYRQRYAYQEENTKNAASGSAKRWMLTKPVEKALQHLYISGSKYGIGEKEKVENAGDGSIYSLLHEKYHPSLRNFLEEFGYYDIFLVDAKSGDVVYSVFKEVDYMTSLFDGPYSTTNFGRAVRKVFDGKDASKTYFEDFEPYEPSYGAEAAFIASGIADKSGNIVGALVFQIPNMDDLFQNADEIGKTAEAFIVGTDSRMRTNSQRVKDTMGKEIHSEIVDNALDKEHLEVEGDNYHGIHMLASSKKLVHDELDWVIMTEIETSEVMAPIYKMIWIIAAISFIVICVIACIGYYAAGSIAAPIVALANHFNASAGNVTTATDQMSDAVHGMVSASEETSHQSVIVRENSSEASGYVGSVSKAVEELNISINDISRSINESNDYIDTAVERAQQTDEVVRRLGEAGNRISDVISLINDLAEQTNLLALNAAIEAARAGDAGRGFAVVADEVKKLASHTSEATSDITDQVKNIQIVSDECVQALRTVVEAIHQIRDSSTTVSAAVEEQGSVTNEISSSVQDAANRVQQVDQNIVGIEQAASDTSVATNQVSEAIDSVSGEFNTMKKEMANVLEEMGIKS